MATTGLLRLKIMGETCVWLAAACAVSMTVAGCPHTRLAWGVFAFGFVWALRYGFSSHVLREVNETKRALRASEWAQAREAATARQSPFSEPIRNYVGVVTASNLPRGASSQIYYTVDAQIEDTYGKSVLRTFEHVIPEDSRWSDEWVIEAAPVGTPVRVMRRGLHMHFMFDGAEKPAVATCEGEPPAKPADPVEQLVREAAVPREGA